MEKILSFSYLHRIEGLAASFAKKKTRAEFLISGGRRRTAEERGGGVVNIDSYCCWKLAAGISESLGDLKKLHTLELPKCQLRKGDLNGIAAHVRRLEVLNLNGNNGLAKTDIFPLLETNGNTLRVFKISEVPIDSIDALLCAQHLEVLDLSWTLITDEGICGIAHLKKLRHLDISGTALSDAGLASFSSIWNELLSMDISACVGIKGEFKDMILDHTVDDNDDDDDDFEGANNQDNYNDAEEKNEMKGVLLSCDEPSSSPSSMSKRKKKMTSGMSSSSSSSTQPSSPSFSNLTHLVASQTGLTDEGCHRFVSSMETAAS